MGEQKEDVPFHWHSVQRRSRLFAGSRGINVWNKALGGRHVGEYVERFDTEDSLPTGVTVIEEVGIDRYPESLSGIMKQSYALFRSIT